MKHPLVGAFMGGFFSYAQTLQTMSQRCCMSNIRVFGQPVHEKKIFKNSPYFTPIRASPLIFANLNSHSPKMLPTKFG